MPQKPKATKQAEVAPRIIPSIPSLTTTNYNIPRINTRVSVPILVAKYFNSQPDQQAACQTSAIIQFLISYIIDISRSMTSCPSFMVFMLNPWIRRSTFKIGGKA